MDRRPGNLAFMTLAAVQNCTKWFHGLMYMYVMELGVMKGHLTCIMNDGVF